MTVAFRNLKVLLVEDDVADADLAQCALRECGLQITVDRVDDGVSCMEYLHQRNGTRDGLPSLILLDLNMPRMDGREVLRQLKAAEALKRIPVVVLTTSVARHDINSSYALGANSFMSKPMDFDEFVAKMRLLVSYWFEAMCLPA